MANQRIFLEFEKAGKLCSVEIVGSRKSIDRLVRSLERDSSVDSYKVLSENERNVSLN